MVAVAPPRAAAAASVVLALAVIVAADASVFDAVATVAAHGTAAAFAAGAR